MPIANYLVSTILEKVNSAEQIKVLESSEKELVTAVFKRRTSPDAPEDMNENHKAFFAQPKELQDQLIGLVGQSVPVAAFIQVLGPVVGPQVHAVFIEGDEIMKSIVKTKTKIMETPLNESQVVLFKISLDIIEKYISGLYSDNLINYYQKQLSRLPQYQTQSNI